MSKKQTEGFLRPETKKQLMETRVVSINQNELNSLRRDLNDAQLQLNELTSNYLNTREQLTSLGNNTKEFSITSSNLITRLIRADRINTIAIVLLAVVLGAVVFFRV